MLSVIIPAYNEDKMIEKTASVIDEILNNEGIDHELIFVNDGSKDNTWQKIEEISKKIPNIVGVNFSRNFGKESALFAGISAAGGECGVVIDCDLQHPPEVIVQMYRLWEQGYEVVEGVKRSRGKESVMHKASAGLFYKMISKAVKIDMSRASDFKLLDRKALDALLSMPERNAFFRALSSWVGFKSTSVEFDVRERELGESKWSTRALIKYAITNIVSFSSAPMQAVTVMGFVMFVLSIVLGIQTLIKFFMGQSVAGFTTVILLILFIGSMVMISLGIIGYYISKIYEEVKGRPKYLIAKTIRSDKNMEE